MRNTISDDTKESIAGGIAEYTGKTASSLAGCAIGAVFAGPGGAAVGAIAAEIYDMYRMSILDSSEAILDSAEINPSALAIVGYGANLYTLMELHNLEQNSELPTIQAQIIEFLIEHEVQGGA